MVTKDFYCTGVLNCILCTVVTFLDFTSAVFGAKLPTFTDIATWKVGYGLIFVDFTSEIVIANGRCSLCDTVTEYDFGN